jgi:hypothetical protein
MSEPDWHKRILDKKWKELEKRGFKRPESKEENDKRAKEAHG